MNHYIVFTKEFGKLEFQADRVGIDKDGHLRFTVRGELIAAFDLWIGFMKRPSA